MYNTQEAFIADLKKAIEKDELLPQKVVEAKNAQEMKAVLSNYEIELTDDEAKQFFEECKNQVSDELNDADLEGVSGGIVVTGTALVMIGGASFLIGVYHGFRGRRK